MRTRNAVELAALETVFLDAGNTLISIDYARLGRELARRGADADIGTLVRAEAAARPATSCYFADRPGQSSVGAFTYYLERILERLPATAGLDDGTRAALAGEVAGVLKQPGADHLLWSQVLPGVPDALASMRGFGLELVVVSNSDGSVARALQATGLATHLTAILDSTVVGYEKPDPRFFEHALAVSGAHPERTLHVGDMYYQDVVGARSAGLDVVLLDPFGDWEVDDCRRCRDLGELAELLGAARAH